MEMVKPSSAPDVSGSQEGRWCQGSIVSDKAKWQCVSKAEGVHLKARRHMVDWKKAYSDPLPTSISWRWPCETSTSWWSGYLYERKFYTHQKQETKGDQLQWLCRGPEQMSGVLTTVLNFRSWQVTERSSFNLFCGSEIVTILSQSWHFGMEFCNKKFNNKTSRGFSFL